MLSGSSILDYHHVYVPQARSPWLSEFMLGCWTCGPAFGSRSGQPQECFACLLLRKWVVFQFVYIVNVEIILSQPWQQR